MNRTRLIVTVGAFLVALSGGAGYFGAQMVVSNSDDGGTGNQVIASPQTTGNERPVIANATPTTPRAQAVTPATPRPVVASSIDKSGAEESTRDDRPTRAPTDETDKALDLAATQDDEIPSIVYTPPDVAGTFVKGEDNSIFLGTGQVDIASVGGHTTGGAVAPSIRSTYNGPLIEVVITRETAIITQKLSGRPTGYGTSAFDAQSLIMAAGTLDEIGINTFVRVWGQRRGDRVVAVALAYLNPQIMQ